ncbi:hypothetical protein HDU99_006460 [Rhizoclosmatium hyalinum]|nr:hypothetical protein HDU99_006460 [Rhizoclosmatium hyalinum]
MLAQILVSSLILTVSSFPWGCRNESHATIVFNSSSLTAQTLNLLRENSLSATFFFTPSWALNNPQIVTDALAQKHSIGLSIPSVLTLVNQTQPCEYGNCDHPVLLDRLEPFLAYQNKTWNENIGYLGARLKLVAFPNTSLLDLRGGHMYTNRYSSLEDAVSNLGYIPIVADFNKDTWNEDTAALEDVALSNFFGAAYLEIGVEASATKEFVKKRGELKDLADTNAVVDASEFLTRYQNVTVVSMSECLGVSVNY